MTTAPAKLRFYALEAPNTVRVANLTDAAISVLVSDIAVPTAVPAAQWTKLDAAAERDFPTTAMAEWVNIYARTTDDGPILACHVPTTSQAKILRITKDDCPLVLEMFDLVPAGDAASAVVIRAMNAAMDASIDGKNWTAIPEGEAHRLEGVTTETMVTVRYSMNQGEVRGGVLVAPGTQIDVTKPPTTKTRLGTNPGAIIRIRR
ncbi:hypothetical protein AMAG_16364 [Allomyces macrogynus ATCC 38327]|uniref:Uncharacterized protein n=1 Tax=Allomyces macrogynus (strain ATCC 38327) TaxID=578462 RepID=A0A0L0TB41_ALLM3|nr:hypothetical protein AMAG_16364 [Allomyces macrogynus ATCC 38327]|eukprot:KNE71941.1 hypothetical protein AMAG_16364 [Allomyces macrogynus ATCC 38327]